MVTRLPSIFLFSLILAMHYALLFGNKNIFTLKDLRQQVVQVENDIDKLNRDNLYLATEILDLKEQGKSIETLARSRLGYIKKGETFFQVIEPRSSY